MRTTAVIAAYNEEGTIADVLRALTTSAFIDEVIVVSDGSQDRTVEISRTFEGVKTIALHHNHGKGFAMAVGVATRRTTSSSSATATCTTSPRSTSPR
ncbi:MAG TPA: glycosyltransferase [Thermoanaerobaculia bacterium]|nr:glycosyltransferase [Thermoanaerobaculia bacterium]